MSISCNRGFVGIDVGKFELVVAQHGSPGTRSYSNDASGIASLVEELSAPGSVCRIGFEATGGYEWPLWEALDQAGLPVRQLAPAQVKAFARSLGQQAKTDGIDAHVIAAFLAFQPEAGRCLPKKKLRRIRALTTLRRQLIKVRKGFACQLKQAPSSEVVTCLRSCLEDLQARVAEVETRLEQLIAQDAELAARASLLQSIPGIGPATAHILLTEMPELGQIGDKQAGALAGLAPFARDSGMSHGNRFIRGGRRQVRTALYMASLAAARFNPDLRRFARRLADRNTPGKKINTAVARKLIVLANAILKRNSPWEARTA